MTRRIMMCLWKIATQTLFKVKCKHIGKGTIIYHPLEIDAPGAISIGDNVMIESFAWLMGNQTKGESLTIKNGTRIGHFSHIVAMDSVTLEENVLIADRVFISDCTHGYEDVETPVIQQCISSLGKITIGEGSWIGENVCVSGANIGKHCIIGANAVVVKDIPDYSVAVGNPARVIKQYNHQDHMWEKVSDIIDEPDGKR